VNTPLRLAVVDDEEITCRRLARRLARSQLSVETFCSAAPYLERLAEAPFDIVLLDVRLPDVNGMEVLRRTRTQSPRTEVVMMTGYASLNDAVEAVKQGAFYYVAKPFTPDQIELIVKRAAEKLELAAENRQLRQKASCQPGFEGIIGMSARMRELFEAAAKVWAIDCNVLIQGESGTGKELLARAIHCNSGRAKGPFVSFNCGGFSEELVANELFGHEREAYTGADTTRIGLMEAAQKGTLFLDEVGEMPLTMQVKLLRVLQERTLLRVGGTRPIHLDIRIICATNKDREREIEESRFRRDLYYRLKVVQLRVPPLRERKEDIPSLIGHFLQKYSLAYHKDVRGFARDALELLMEYSFPGNVRELENIVSGAVALADGELITAADLPADIEELRVDTLAQEEFVTLEENERTYIARVLSATHGNRTRAARLLDLPRTSLWRKIRKYGLADTEPPGRVSS
jgi:two-component system, NtrC family, response regulator AtoC